MVCILRTVRRCRHAWGPRGPPKILAQHASAGCVTATSKSPRGMVEIRDGERADVFVSRIALRQPPQDFLQSPGKTQSAQNQCENQFRVQPTIQKKYKHPA